VLLSIFCSSCHQNRDNNPHPPPPPPVGDEEEECASNIEVHAMMKAMTKLFTKNQQSSDMTLEWVEHSIARIIDRGEALLTRVPTMDQDKFPDNTHEGNYDEVDEEEVEDGEPFNPPPRSPP
jgi:hypothetical protein